MIKRRAVSKNGRDNRQFTNDYQTLAEAAAASGREAGRSESREDQGMGDE